MYKKIALLLALCANINPCMAMDIETDIELLQELITPVTIASDEFQKPTHHLETDNGGWTYLKSKHFNRTPLVYYTIVSPISAEYNKTVCMIRDAQLTGLFGNNFSGLDDQNNPVVIPTLDLMTGLPISVTLPDNKNEKDYHADVISTHKERLDRLVRAHNPRCYTDADQPADFQLNDQRTPAQKQWALRAIQAGNAQFPDPKEELCTPIKQYQNSAQRAEYRARTANDGMVPYHYPQKPEND